MNGPFREQPVEERLNDLDRRISEMRTGAERYTRVEALKALADSWYGVAVGGALLIATLLGCGTYIHSCAHAESVETRARQLEDDAREADRPAAVCRELCVSMGLRGGVLVDYHGTWHPDPTGACGNFDVERTGHSCICGNGMGGAVRVDPDGAQHNEEDHPGPARDGGT